MATIPPWIITPDAAGRYLQGYSLGTDVASKRAAQRVQQQQMALQQQSMMQRQQANAEIAAREAIQMQLNEQFRKVQLTADSSRLAQAAQQAELAREQAGRIAQDQIASREKIAGMQYGPIGGIDYKSGVTTYTDPQDPDRIVAYGVNHGGKTSVFKADDTPEESLRKKAIAEAISGDGAIPLETKLSELNKLFSEVKGKSTNDSAFTAEIEIDANGNLRFKR